MILIYGTGTYGKIEQHEGQYAATRFFHLYWVPLFPVSSTIWIQETEDEHYRGHRMNLSWKSIAAAYLRTWGALIGGVYLLSSLFSERIGEHVGALLIGALLVSAALYSWSWRKLSAAEAYRRELFASVTNTYCDPDLLPDDMAASLRQSIEAIWEKSFSSQTPSDVARFGTKEPAQAALAYSLVRLMARETEPEKKPELLSLAEKIALNTPQEKLPQENPYRTSVQSNYTSARE